MYPTMSTSTMIQMISASPTSSEAVEPHEIDAVALTAPWRVARDRFEGLEV